MGLLKITVLTWVGYLAYSFIRGGEVSGVSLGYCVGITAAAIFVNLGIMKGQRS